MTQPVLDLVLEMANEVQKLGRTKFAVYDLQAKGSGVLTGLNLVIAWLQAGGGTEAWTLTGNLLIALTQPGSETDLEGLIQGVNSNYFLPAGADVFSVDLYVSPEFRISTQVLTYEEGICKGFLYGMRLYDNFDCLSSERRTSFVVGHLANIKKEIEVLF